MKKKQHVFVSIIIPVFDVSAYLTKCIESARCQTLKEIEIILINDCSPDPLDDQICNEYANSDNRIKYICYTENKGQGAARNTGIENATGDYIWFVDSDDFIDINACKFLYTLAMNTGTDIVAFSATSHVDGDLNLDLSTRGYYRYKRDTKILNQAMQGKDFIALARSCDSFHVSSCLQIFKRRLISQYRFREQVFHEDTDLIPIVIYNASSIYCTEYSPYYRLLRNDSVTQKKLSANLVTDKFLAVESLFKYVQSLADTEEMEKNPLLDYANQLYLDTNSIYDHFEEKDSRTEEKFHSTNITYADLQKTCNANSPTLITPSTPTTRYIKQIIKSLRSTLLSRKNK
jgi:glycosyltransferase involved in cell wall biosynthesis